MLWLRRSPSDRVAQIELLQSELKRRGPSSQAQRKKPAGAARVESPMRYTLRLDLVVGHINKLSIEAKTWLRDALSEQLGLPP